MFALFYSDKCNRLMNWKNGVAVAAVIAAAAVFVVFHVAIDRSNSETDGWKYRIGVIDWNTVAEFRIICMCICFLYDIDRRRRGRSRLRCTNKHVVLPQLIFEHQRCWDSCSYHCILVVDLECVFAFVFNFVVFLLFFCEHAWDCNRELTRERVLERQILLKYSCRLAFSYTNT